MEQQTATNETLSAEINWSADAQCVDDSEQVSGEVVEDSKGLLTIMENPTLFHRVVKGSNGDLLLRSMNSKDQRNKDTHIKGRVDDVEVSL